MFALIVVLVKPCVEIGLQGGDRVVDLPAERDAIELVEHGLVKSLDDSVGLWRTSFGTGVINVLHGQIELIFVMLGVSAVLGTPVSQNASERNTVAVEERHDAIIEQVGCRQRGLAVVELGKRHL